MNTKMDITILVKQINELIPQSLNTVNNDYYEYHKKLLSLANETFVLVDEEYKRGSDKITSEEYQLLVDNIRHLTNLINNSVSQKLV